MWWHGCEVTHIPEANYADELRGCAKNKTANPFYLKICK